MEFRTAIDVKPAEKSIDFNSGVALFGSCFSENIAKKIAYFQIPHFKNSHGILFNPIAIEEALSDCAKKRKYTEGDLICRDDILAKSWASFVLFRHKKRWQLLNKINRSIEEGNAFLKSNTHLILTLGTAWIYTHHKNTIVGNCHKIPQKEFDKTLLSVDEIIQSLTNIVLNMRALNPGMEIIFTLSPVRHLKDGFVENSLGKANLLAAIHSVCRALHTHYFPSYEIMMDDLRDYRFYNADMIHPNQIAIDYIWELFRETWIDPAVYPVMNEVDAIQKDP
ncbi:MAG: GSCFA domain-containing protein [Flavobacteriaceae bacterium]|nr:GSCFA domain-containing protein [Flavobacteriaceae bacterium]